MKKTLKIEIVAINIANVSYEQYIQAMMGLQRVNWPLTTKKIKKLKVSKVISHFALCVLLSEKLDLEITGTMIDTNKFGKKNISTLDKVVFFNISHSGDWVLLAFSNDTEIGIDIEKKGLNQIDCRLPYFLSSNSSLLALMYNKKFDFFHLWTVIESYVKYLGTGFNKDLTSVIFSIYHGVGKVNDTEDSNSANFEFLEMDREYVTCICYQSNYEKQVDIELHLLPTKQLIELYKKRFCKHML